MAEKKKTNKTKKNNKEIVSSNTKKKTKKEEKIIEKEEVVIKKKKNSKIKNWYNNLTLEKITLYGIIIIVILLLVLIFVATKNTKTKDGKDIVVKLSGKSITADDLYAKMKEAYGKDIAINLVDEYILNTEYKTTEDMLSSAIATVNNYKSSYGDNYQSFLEYNGIKDDEELKELLIKNEKLVSATEDYIKDNLTEAEMKNYYETSIYGDIEAKHILISVSTTDSQTDEEKQQADSDAKAKAESIIEELKNGADFDELAKKYSDDTSTKENGGSLGYFNTGDMVQEFEDAAIKLSVGEYSTTPVKTAYGYHIIMKTNQKEKPSYEKSKDTIIEKLVKSKKENDTDISTKALLALRKKYKMKIKDKKIKELYEAETK